MSTISQFPIVTPAGRADVASHALCRVCQRDVTSARPDDTGGVLACDLCLHVDATLALLHGAELFTPLNLRDHAPADVLYHRMFGPSGDRAAALGEFHTAALRSKHDVALAEGTRYLVVTYPGAPWHDLFVDRARWQERFPASLEASVRSYGSYVAAVHPWATSVEPGLLDPGWLAGLVLAGVAR